MTREDAVRKAEECPRRAGVIEHQWGYYVHVYSVGPWTGNTLGVTCWEAEALEALSAALREPASQERGG